MKQVILRSKTIIGLGLLATLITATAVARSGKQDFVLHNETGVEIHELYVSPTTTDDWEEDMLGVDTLPAGDSVKVTFEDREHRAKWDMKVVDGKGNSIEWKSLNLIEISDVTLHYENGKAWAEIK
jgi:hypothetical protein